MTERGGKAKVYVLPSVRGATILPAIRESIKPGSTVITDELNVYHAIERMGFRHRTIHHTRDQYVAGNIHTNTVEGLWSLIKRGIAGVYHNVGAHYLQSYIDEYVFRYNHRHDFTPMFRTFLQRVAHTL